MIYLYQFPAIWGLPNASPFCMKVETYLRLTHLPYEIKTVINPRKSPKGKLPIIKDNNRVVADSGFIIDYLKATYGDILDKHLTPMQHSQAIALQRMLEEHLYWVMIYSRWIEPDGWMITKRDFFADLPSILKLFVPDMVRKDFKKALHCQGMGRHTRDEIYELGKKDILSLATVLGTQSFIFGYKPTTIDAIAYAFLVNILQVPGNNPLKEFTYQIPTLRAYVERMTQCVNEEVCIYR